MKLHGYFRSGAAYRVRIALNLKGIAVEHVSHHLRKGEQRAPAYLQLNPQGLLPTLEIDPQTRLTQSLAIIEWLDETYPNPPLLPHDSLARARVRAFALAIVCDVHPIQNLRILNKVRELGVPEAAVTEWGASVNENGMSDCEAMLKSEPGPFCFGTAPTLADICLVPQLNSARRFKVDITRFPRLLAAEAAAKELSAFSSAAPEVQPDAE